MQEQGYESFSSESETDYAWPVARDTWNEGEKLRSEPRRKKSVGKLSPLAIMIIAIIVIAVLFFAGALMFMLTAHSMVEPAIHVVPKP